jgi:hypothetical protein
VNENSVDKSAQRIRLENSAAYPLEVYFEPWGSMVKIAPDDFIEVEFKQEWEIQEGMMTHPHLVFHNDHFVSVFVGSGSNFIVFDSQQMEIPT